MMSQPSRSPQSATACERGCDRRSAAPALDRATVGGVALLAALALGSDAARAADWVRYVEAPSRIVSEQGLVTDPEEKDLATGDVDRDGDSDVVVVRKEPFKNAGAFPNVLFMNEGGVMTDRTATLAPDFLVPTDDRDVELVDVNGDDWLDIVTAGSFGEQPRILINLGSSEGVWLGFEYQPARLPVLLSPTGNGPKFCGLGVGDVTGDLRPDIYFSDYDNNMEDKLLINDGTGHFADETATRMTPAMAVTKFGNDADIADLNGDGFNDLIKDNATGSDGGPLGTAPEVLVLYNDGTGHFTSSDPVDEQAPYQVALADFTQDGRLDLFIVDDAQDKYLINTGNDAQGHAQFSVHTVATSPHTNFFGGNTEFVDLDADGILDVFVADVDTDSPGCTRRLALLRGQGTPPNITYADPFGGGARPWLLQGVMDVATLHLDDDGLLDLWLATCSGHRIFMSLHPVFLFSDDFEDGTSAKWMAVQQ